MKKVLPKRKPERTHNTKFFGVIWIYGTGKLFASTKLLVYLLKRNQYFFINSHSNLIHFLSIFSSFCKNLRQIRERRKALQIVHFRALGAFNGRICTNEKVPPGSVESIPTSTIFQIEHRTRNSVKRITLRVRLANPPYQNVSFLYEGFMLLRAERFEPEKSYWLLVVFVLL